MHSKEIRKRFLAFFEKRGHTVIPSASLLPSNDPSVLFTTAGMQPLVPYLLGEKHPSGARLANFQKCVRTGDIDEVGDNTHATFFEMMGNWSLGDYFKEDAIRWSFELLTSKEEGFGLDPHRLYVTCFEGNDDAPQDEESAEIWRTLFKEAGIEGERIYFMPAEKNWWQPGPNGPCGPDTEMFYDLTGTLTSGLTKEEFLKADNDQKIVEIWNDVFMEYLKKDDVVVGMLEHKNVDTGSGFERVCAVLQNKDNIFDTDIFEKIMEVSKTLATSVRSQRIIADHVRTAVFMLSEGVVPLNTDRGYVLRRLIRRAVFNTDAKTIPHQAVKDLVEAVALTYHDVYRELYAHHGFITEEFFKESEKFAETLARGLKEFEKMEIKSVADVFKATASFGLPIDMASEVARARGFSFLREEMDIEMKKHQNLSRAGAEQKFKGGMGDTSEMSIKYHTATHLLGAALRQVLGDHVKQRGSNITSERLRFDFSHGEKMTDEQKQAVETLVNNWISEELFVVRREMPLEEAEHIGAQMEFGTKYPNVVSIYFIERPDGTVISKEFCGGPHVETLKDLGTFSIQKEEASSAGVRRIKAVLS
ncbi:MAG: alanine--tRNA ligase [Patescibacteria group bacterium]